MGNKLSRFDENFNNFNLFDTKNKYRAKVLYIYDVKRIKVVFRFHKKYYTFFAHFNDFNHININSEYANNLSKDYLNNILKKNKYIVDINIVGFKNGYIFINMFTKENRKSVNVNEKIQEFFKFHLELNTNNLNVNNHNTNKLFTNINPNFVNELHYKINK